MTPQATPDIDAPHGLVAGAIVRVEKAAAAGDWRLLDHDVWQVVGTKTEQKREDAAPRLYVKLQSVLRMNGLAFITVPFDPDSMSVSPPPGQMPAAGVMFPEPGSQVYIRESDDPARPSHRDGLWEVGKAVHKPAEDGSRQVLQLSLKSLGRVHQAYLNVAFNTATMKPVTPAYLEAGGMVNVEAARDVAVMKPLVIKKRNAAP